MSDEKELPHVVVDPWDFGAYGRKIEPPYGLVITAVSDLQGWLRNCAEQTNTDEAGTEYKELVVPEIKILALIDKLKEVGETYLDEQRHDSNTYNEALNEANLLHLGAERGLKRARRRIRELRLLNKGLRLAIRSVAKDLELEGL
jgi:hypothetical protein